MCILVTVRVWYSNSIIINGRSAGARSNRLSALTSTRDLQLNLNKNRDSSHDSSAHEIRSSRCIIFFACTYHEQESKDAPVIGTAAVQKAQPPLNIRGRLTGGNEARCDISLSVKIGSEIAASSNTRGVRTSTGRILLPIRPVIWRLSRIT